MLNSHFTNARAERQRRSRSLPDPPRVEEEARRAKRRRAGGKRGSAPALRAASKKGAGLRPRRAEESAGRATGRRALPAGGEETESESEPSEAGREGRNPKSPAVVAEARLRAPAWVNKNSETEEATAAPRRRGATTPRHKGRLSRDCSCFFAP